MPDRWDHRITGGGEDRDMTDSDGTQIRSAAIHVQRSAAGRIVAVRQGHLMATSFHPEVGRDDRIHRLFVDLVTQS